jgi:hypothetical protein
MALAKIKNKIVFIGLGILTVCVGVLFIIRFSTSEDAWICSQKGWEKHGNPAAEIPKETCPEPANEIEL